MNREPVRLAKKDNNVSPFLNKIEMKLEDWVWRHAHILLPIFIMLGIILFVLLCYAICGVSAVESGTQYRMEAWI